jgi:hypothetical protein
MTWYHRTILNSGLYNRKIKSYSEDILMPLYGRFKYNAHLVNSSLD